MTLTINDATKHFRHYFSKKEKRKKEEEDSESSRIYILYY